MNTIKALIQTCVSIRLEDKSRETDEDILET